MSFACRVNYDYNPFTARVSGNYRHDMVTTSPAPGIRFYADGTVDNTQSTPLTNWGSPTTSAVGALYWVRLIKTAGAGVVAGGPYSTWLQLNTTQSFRMNSATAGQFREISGTWEISTDSGGSTIVGSGTFNLSSDLT
jgi:hypothetical protein